MRRKYKKYYILVPDYVEKEHIREFYNKSVDEIKAEVDIESLKTLPLTTLDIKRELSFLSYPSYISLHDKSWWVLLDEDLKYKILYSKFYDLYSKRTLSPQVDNSRFYKAYYVDKGKIYVMNFTDYLALKGKKYESRKSIRQQLKEKEERKKKYLEKKLMSERFLSGEI